MSEDVVPDSLAISCNSIAHARLPLWKDDSGNLQAVLHSASQCKSLPCMWKTIHPMLSPWAEVACMLSDEGGAIWVSYTVCYTPLGS